MPYIFSCPLCQTDAGTKAYKQNLGVHPLVTLISMYSGFKFFGVIGFLIGPVVMIILKNVFSRELEVGFFRGNF